MKTFASLHSARCIAAATILTLLNGCVLLTDGATRLAYDLESASRTLRRSEAQTLSFVHQPASWPDGVTGEYEVVLQESLHHPVSGGALLVGDLRTRSYANWGTSYHLNFVRVPEPLQIRKSKGESVTVELRKNGAAIDVASLK
jgi:hypothetical protein